MKDKKTCGTCKYFIGGGDPSSGCDMYYDYIYPEEPACKLYEPKEG